MDLMRYDFTAPAGTHFGKLKTVSEMIAEIANPVDYWTPAADRVTQSGGLITKWTGAAGRTLSQATVSKQPALAGSEILFGDGAGALKACLSLDGTAIGAISDLTIAGRFRLPASALTVDSHFLFGTQTTPSLRLCYRYVTSPLLRMDSNVSGSVMPIMDLALPVGTETIPVILRVSGTTAITLIVGAARSVSTLPGTLTLNDFTIGGAALQASDWPGWIGKFGIWKSAATDAQIAALQSWLG